MQECSMDLCRNAPQRPSCVGTMSSLTSPISNEQCHVLAAELAGRLNALPTEEDTFRVLDLLTSRHANSLRKWAWRPYVECDERQAGVFVSNMQGNLRQNVHKAVVDLACNSECV